MTDSWIYSELNTIWSWLFSLKTICFLHICSCAVFYSPCPDYPFSILMHDYFKIHLLMYLWYFYAVCVYKHRYHCSKIGGKSYGHVTEVWCCCGNFFAHIVHVYIWYTWQFVWVDVHTHTLYSAIETLWSTKTVYRGRCSGMCMCEWTSHKSLHQAKWHMVHCFKGSKYGKMCHTVLFSIALRIHSC